MKLIPIGRAGSLGALAVSLLAGCSWTGGASRNAGAPTSASALASRSASLPVATGSRTDGRRTEIVATRASSDGTRPGDGGARRTEMKSLRRLPNPSEVAAGELNLSIDGGEEASADDVRPSNEAVPPEKLVANQAASEFGASILEAAVVLELRGDLDGAAREFERAVEAAPDDAKTLVGYARFADRHGRGELAADLYGRLLELDGVSPLLWSEAGLCLARHGRLEAGVAACRKAVEADPDNRRLAANLSAALAVGATLDAYRQAAAPVGPHAPGEPSAPSSAAGVDPADPADGSTFRTTSRSAEPAATVETPAEASGPAWETAERPSRPFAPGSTARQFERPLPPVKTKR